MDDIIRDLESRVKLLIRQCEHLKEINSSLSQIQSQLTQENELLKLRQQNILKQIEHVVFQLKSTEKEGQYE